MTTTPLFDLENVTVERDSTQILQDCSWQVHPGENWVIFGPNGAGKTSLLNVLQGYLWPTRGRVRSLEARWAMAWMCAPCDRKSRW